METIVIALGGNAIVKSKQFGTVSEQFANTREAMKHLVEIFKRGYNFVLTHGNGPQVGNILIRVEASQDKAYPIPLGVAVAQTQGEMGYMIAQCLHNMLVEGNLRRTISCVLTQVVCDKDDPAMLDPTKYVGPFYESEEQIQKLRERGEIVKMDANRGWRRVVPSPRPKAIVEKDTIRTLVEAGILVVAAGGGGAPVYYEDNGKLEGIDAVVDKDLASALLAAEIGARKLVIITGVQKVATHFGTPHQQEHDRLTVSEAKQFFADGHFPPGNMGPKVEAAIWFLENGGEKVMITDIENIEPAFEGRTGTLILPDFPRF